MAAVQLRLGLLAVALVSAWDGPGSAPGTWPPADPALLPAFVSATPPASIRMLSLMEGVSPVVTLDRSLAAIRSSHGRPTAEFVALTMEYAWAP